MARNQEARSTSRRRFCWTLTGVFVAPGIALAQASKPVRRIGVLEPGMGPSTHDDFTQAEALRQLGWVEGQNLQVERRFANGRLEALQPLAEELVRAHVEIIVTGGTPATLAAKRASTTIPIVFWERGRPRSSRPGREPCSTRRQRHRIFAGKPRGNRQTLVGAKGAAARTAARRLALADGEPI